MKSVENIFNKTKHSPREYAGIKNILNGQYNISYLLSHEQIQAGALLKISEKLGISISEAAKQYYIDGVSLAYDRGQEPDISSEAMEIFFGQSIENAIKAAKKGKPAFISLDNGKHFVLAALVPDHNNPHKLSVVYINSMPEDLPEYKEHPFATTGKKFADSLLKYIEANKNKFKIELSNTAVLDMSREQQLGNCCGLSVASNIASVALHVSQNKPASKIVDSLFAPTNAKEKTDYYQKLGKELFTALDNTQLDLNRTYSKSLIPTRPVSTNDDPYEMAHTMINNGNMEIAIDIIRGLQLTNNDIHPSNVKLIAVLEEIEKQAGGIKHSPPLIQGYLKTIRSFDKKIEIDILNNVKEVTQAFEGDTLKIESVLNRVPISTKIKVSQNEADQINEATASAKMKKNLSEAFDELRSKCPISISKILSCVTSFVYKSINQVKTWLGTLATNHNESQRHK
jgi:hypothetical protein